MSTNYNNTFLPVEPYTSALLYIGATCLYMLSCHFEERNFLEVEEEGRKKTLFKCPSDTLKPLHGIIADLGT